MRAFFFSIGLLSCSWINVMCRTTPQWPPTPKSKIEVQGHRGCRGLRPENTLAGFRHAIQLGVDVLELDLALTRDKVLVAAHDPQVNPTICTGGEQLSSRQFRELTQYDDI